MYLEFTPQRSAVEAANLGATTASLAEKFTFDCE
jgi:hypothetical protein